MSQHGGTYSRLIRGSWRFVGLQYRYWVSTENRINETQVIFGKVDPWKIYCSNTLQTFNTEWKPICSVGAEIWHNLTGFHEQQKNPSGLWKSTNLQTCAPKMLFLVSQDALEVMRLTDSLTEWGLALTWLMWPWWVMIPIEDFTDSILITLMDLMTLMKVIHWWKLSSDESYLVMKVI